MTWTQVEDVRSRYNRTIPQAQRAWVAQLLADAEDELSLVVADLAARITSQEVPLDRVKRIVAYAVIRVMRNPEGYVSQSTTRGPFSNSVTRAAGTTGAGRIEFSDEDLAALRPDISPVRSVRTQLSRWQIP